jgi:fibro-slime domain-containing protein
MLAYTAITSLLPVPQVTGASGEEPDTIELVGVVRDFRRDHTDFNIPSSQFGHVAGNVSLLLGEHNRPDYVGGGLQVTEQWKNRYYQPIAPHMFRAQPEDVIPLVNSPQIANNCELDTWDSTQGNYGGSNVGPEPSFQMGATMPDVLEPEAGPNVGDLVSWPGGTIVLDEDIHCDRLSIPQGRRVEVHGAITILCEEEVTLGDEVRFELQPGASVQFFFKQSVNIGEDADVNKNTHDPSLMQVINLGGGELHMADDANLYARVISPGGPLRLSEHADFYGTFTGLTLVMADHADFHLDMAPAGDGCGTPFEDHPGVFGAPNSGAVTSADTFVQWYRDFPGTNLSALHTITLVDAGGGTWSYETDDFHPIDDQMFGNEGDAHNYHFTYAIDALFVYDRCAGQYFAFDGDDDVWAFVDDDLVMDAAGVKPGTAQFIEADRLGLVDGRIYRFRLFFAQRQAVSSRFNLKTTIHFMSPDQVASLTAPFD